jgi:hypothetical protein
MAEVSTTCGFSFAGPELVTRIVTAVVDQTVACTDTALPVLDALEMPLGEAIHWLSSFGRVEAVTVHWRPPGELSLLLSGRDLSPVPDTELFGDSAELIGAFFRSEWVGPHEICLTEVA